MDKKTNTEANSEKFDSKEIKRDEIDSPIESIDLENKGKKNTSEKTILKLKPKIESKDYFLDKLKEANQLGYKSKLDLIIRTEIKNLEREVAKAIGLNVDEIRQEFLNLKKLNHSLVAKLSFIPNIFFISDYRTFLINAITIFTYKKIHKNRFK